MATITPTFFGRVPVSGDQSFPADSFVAVWENATDADTLVPIELGAYSDRSMQVAGSVGSPAATITGAGSNDGATYATLNDLQGNALSFTAAGLEGIAEATRYFKPVISGGTGESVDIYVYARK